MLNPVTEVSQLKRTIAELTKQNTDYESKIEYLNMQLEEITLEMMNTNNHHELEDLRNRLEHEKAIRRDIELQLSK
jgi:DNA repair ATPase RecN